MRYSDERSLRPDSRKSTSRNKARQKHRRSGHYSGGKPPGTGNNNDDEEISIWEWIGYGVSIGFLALVIIGLILPDSSTDQEQSSNIESQETTSNGNDTTDSTDGDWAYKLATIQEGYVERDALIVNRFEYLLRRLTQQTGNTRQEIADISVTAVQTIEEEYGRNVSLRHFMEEAVDSIPASMSPERISYKNIAVDLVLLMGQ